MSLAVLADHMASKGRGPDSMLIHMSPREVQGLQALAENHGGSLTINPETGLPEAGFLDKLLPTIIGAGLTFFGGVPPHIAAMMVGGVETVRTGDIGKGISAGLGAYGGANLTSGFMEAGASTIGATEAAKGLTMSPELLAEFGGNVEKGISANDLLLQQQVTDKIAAATPFEKLSSGFDAFKNNPMGMTKSLAMPAAMAFGPAILAGANVQNKLPQTVTKPGMIRPYSFDPYGGSYTAGIPYEAQVKKAAGGGLMGMDNGGYNPGQLNFAQQSEPVMRMAKGGIAGYAGNEGSLVGGDAALAAYQAGDYATASQLLGEAGMSAQDVVSKYGLSQEDAATVAQNLGYAGDMSGIQYAAAPAAVQEAPVDYFSQQFAPDVNNPVATPTATDSALAAYQAGDYTTASQLLAAAGMNAQDVVNTYGLGQADAATVAQNLGYTGDMSGLQYAFAPPVVQTAPVVTAPVTDTSRGLAALNTATTNTAATNTPQYIQYSDQQVSDWFSKNKDATDAQVKQAIIDSKIDPAAVNRYIASLTSPFVGSSETKGGSGTLGIYNRMVAEGFTPKEAYDALIANDPKYAGWSLADIERGYNLDKGAYALTDQIAKDKIAPDPVLGYDKQWVKFMDNNKYTVDEMAQAFGISKNEIQRRYNDVKAAERVVTPPVVTPPVVTPKIITGVNDYGLGGSGTSGRLESVYGPALPPGVSGAGITTVNPNGTITTRPDLTLPMSTVRDNYEKGGGSLGVNKNLFAPKTQDELFARYKNTGGSKAALDYLMGKTPYSPTPYTPTGEIQKPYFESVGRFPENRKAKKYVYVDGKYQLNPDYVKPSYVLAGEKAAADKAAATEKAAEEKATTATTTGSTNDRESGGAARGGLMAMARGGMSQQFDLGGYSDGGRLLRGPGDGVSDSIPATIGNKRPARLADGEFVVPARIVSELGNGSTEAGARKLYAMMDRVQKARRGTVGKGRVAKNSRSEKYLPA